MAKLVWARRVGSSRRKWHLVNSESQHGDIICNGGQMPYRDPNHDGLYEVLEWGEEPPAKQCCFSCDASKRFEK